MSTRALQDGMMLLGFRDPVTDDVLAGGSVEFYGAGTAVAKNAWEDKDKATAITSVTLDSSGQAQVYFDGVYKFVVKNSSGTTKYTLDNLKYQARNTSTVTKTADYQATMDDDFILVDTDSGNVTITLAAVAGVVAPITIKNIGSSSNSCIVDGSGAETIDGAATATLTDGGAQQYVTDSVQWYAAGASSGTTYTTTTLVSGTNNSFDVGSGITTINVPSASNTVLGAIEISTDAEAVTGTSEILAVNPKQLKVVQDSVMFTKQYISTAQTITSAGNLILPHGLAAEPKLIQLIIQCTTDDNGYTIGDRVIVGYSSSDAANSRASVSPTIDATNIDIRFTSTANVFFVGNKATGASALLTNSSWQLYVNAWT